MMKLRARLAQLFLLGVLALPSAAAPPPATSPTPAAVLAATPPNDWEAIDPETLLVLTLASGRRVAIALEQRFAPIHVANIRTLVRAHWFDGLWVSRVQENYVVQWGDPDGKKPLPSGIVMRVPPEYERAAAGLPFWRLPYRDTFAPRVGLVAGWPVAQRGGQAWLAHCYGMVGVGHDNAPDTGTGAELYAVTGHAPRALDRNITLVGRVIDGMDALTSLPRGTADLGFYAEPAQRAPIAQIRLASDLPPGERPGFEMLRTGSPSFAAWVHARANRRDSFFVRPAGAIDLCNVLPPVRSLKP